MRQLHSNRVEYAVIPCLFHFLSSPVPVPSSGRQRAKLRLKIRKKTLPFYCIQLESNHCCFEFASKQQKALENGSEGAREGGRLGEKKKIVLLNVDSTESFIYFILLHSLSLATAGVGARAGAL